MFGSEVLEVGIGMALLFLFASLIATAAQEAVEGFLKHRASDLEKGIGELLRSDAARIALYKHPFVYSLYAGSYEEAKKSKSLPSYIPKANFTNAILDLITKGGFAAAAAADKVMSDAAAKAAADKAAAKAAADKLISDAATKAAADTAAKEAAAKAAEKVVSEAAAKAAGDKATAEVAARAAADTAGLAVTAAGKDASDRRLATIDANAQPPVALAGATPGAPPIDPGKVLDTLRLSELRATAEKVEPAELKQAIVALLDDAGNDLSKLRSHIEGWYDGTMDRVAGWFKRRTQGMLFLFGLVVAVGLNIDAITVAQRLLSDKTLRDSVVKFADNNLDELGRWADRSGPSQPVANAAGAEPGGTPPAKAEPAITPPPAAPAGKSDGAGAGGGTGQPLPNPGVALDKKEAQPAINPAVAPSVPTRGRDAFRALEAQVRSIGYPIGWIWFPAAASPQWEDLESWLKLRNWVSLLKQSYLYPEPQACRVDETGVQRCRLTFGGVLTAILGWFATALAIMLGAPFWFDVLNKFMVIRSTVKPKEKSPEEGSEDRANAKGSAAKA